MIIITINYIGSSTISSWLFLDDDVHIIIVTCVNSRIECIAYIFDDARVLVTVQ